MPQTFSIDNDREIQRMIRWAKTVVTPKTIRRAMRAGFRGLGAPFAREIRRILRSHGLSRGLSTLLANIAVVVKVNKRTGEVVVRIGARNRRVNGKNPANYFHLFDGGTAPHFQPNAWRLISSGGRRVLVKIDGGDDHPGAEAHPTRDVAARRAGPEMFSRFGKRFFATVERELKKST